MAPRFRTHHQQLLFRPSEVIHHGGRWQMNSLWWKAFCQKSTFDDESGLTLIECLVAIIIVTITVAIITPPVFIAVATRVNNRQTEQALQLAQAEIERVRVLMISNRTFVNIEPELPAIAAVASPDALTTVPAPVGTVCDAPPPEPCSSALVLFEPSTELISDASSVEPNFYLQSFRDSGATLTRQVNGAPVDETIAFNMGVRVYAREAVDGGSARAGLLTEPGSVNFTSGLKTRSSRPLVALYTELTRGAQADSLQELKEYTGTYQNN